MADENSQNKADPGTEKFRAIIIAAVVLMLGITLGPKLFAKFQDRQILENGTLAPATIIDLDETGNQVNRQPEIEITFEVEGADGEPFTSKGVQVLSPLELKRYDVGTKVQIRYDPDKRNKAVLVGLDPNAKAAKSASGESPAG